jgi:hypothetical protein
MELRKYNMMYKRAEQIYPYFSIIGGNKLYR